MEKVTAIVQSVVREGNGYRVTWSYSDGTPDQSEIFDETKTKSEVAAVIKARLKQINDAYVKAASLQSFIGTVIE